MGDVALLRQDFVRPRRSRGAPKRAKAEAAMADLFDDAVEASPPPRAAPAGPRDREGLPDTIQFWKRAIEQLDPVPLLERRDRGAGRRLGEIQRLSRARHVLAFGDADENAQLLQRHRRFALRGSDAPLPDWRRR